ncbi:MAG: serine protease [Nanoarchaeota archaeon]|nr:serine protease [Nanoarchaeota archaeon]
MEETKELIGERSRSVFILLLFGLILVLGMLYLIIGLILFSPLPEQKTISSETLNDVEDTIVWVKYRVNGKHRDGSYFENAGGSGSGILYGREGTNYLVITNRHVVDCTYHSVSCYQRLNETVSIRTLDGKLHPVSRVLFAPHNLDIAILEVDTGGDEYPTAHLRLEEIERGEEVIAVGYPRFAKGFTEFKTSQGVVTEKRTIITGEGFGFEAISSDAYTNFGSSGGGLFDSEGKLIGVNTWKAGETSVAASIRLLNDADDYHYCKEGYYFTNDGCVKYCEREQVLGKNGKCQSICDSFYCESTIPNIDDKDVLMGAMS